MFYILFLPFAFGLLIDLFKLPTFIRFSLDFVLFGVILILFSRTKNKILKKTAPLVAYFSLLTLYLIVSYVINYQSFLYFFWGYRNSFRFVFALLAFINFINTEDTERYLYFFDVLFWVNFAVCLVQFYLMGYKQDFLGGLFGVSVGCNVYLNVFLCIVTVKSIIYFLNKKERFASTLLKLFASFFLSALSELKFFYIEFIVILCVVSLITKFTWKKLAIIAVSLCGVVIGVSILIQIFPEYVGKFTIELLYESAASDKGYTSSGDINRLSAISTISNEMFYKWYHYFIGFGLGNCDLSSISVFNTPFFESHSEVNYNWFSHAFMYLETGYIGLILFFGLFVLIFLLALRSYKQSYADPNHCQLTMTIAVLCILFSIYNTTLRADSVYMISFIFALPFIKKQSVANSLSPEIG